MVITGIMKISVTYDIIDKCAIITAILRWVRYSERHANADICHHSNIGLNYQMWETPPVVGSKHPGDCSPGSDRVVKMSSFSMYVFAMLAINISTQGCKVKLHIGTKTVSLFDYILCNWNFLS